MMFVLSDISLPMLSFFGISKGLHLMVKQLGTSVVGKDTCLAYLYNPGCLHVHSAKVLVMALWVGLDV